MTQDGCDFYVYALYREDGVTPFYIGKGRGKRWMRHEQSCRRERSHKAHIIRSMLDRGFTVPKRKLATGLSHERALSVERQMIAEIGRQFEGGSLANAVAGGDGNWNPSPETRQKLSEHAKNRSAEHRAKLVAAQTGRPKSAEQTGKMAATKRGQKLSAEHRANIARGNTGRQFTDEQRQKISSSLKGSAAFAEAHARTSAARRGRPLSEELCQKLAEARQRRGPTSDETREKLRALWRSPEHREKMSKARGAAK
jgi:hypothetical protein